MSIAKRPSKITLPPNNKGWNNLFEFLLEQFPLITPQIWQQRLEQGKIHWLSGELATMATSFRPSQVLCYYREVQAEPEIPFQHRVIYQDEHILVADKPHFLPVTPGGIYVNECLLERLRQQLNLPNIVPCHRLDRETAGLVLFSINPQTRADYCQLFAQGKINKTYQAVAKLPQNLIEQTNQAEWLIENRLAKSQPKFLMQQVEGEINARSKINLIAKKGELGLFELNPITGKTHQLRLHMMAIGAPILNDDFYPVLQPKKPLTFSNPLQLLAKNLSFTDPLSQKIIRVNSNYQLTSF